MIPTKNNNSKLFLLSVFSSGATNFTLNRLETLPTIHTQVLDAHNHPFFNKRVVSVNFIDKRVHSYKSRFSKQKQSSVTSDHYFDKIKTFSNVKAVNFDEFKEFFKTSPPNDFQIKTFFFDTLKANLIKSGFDLKMIVKIFSETLK